MKRTVCCKMHIFFQELFWYIPFSIPCNVNHKTDVSFKKKKTYVVIQTDSLILNISQDLNVCLFLAKSYDSGFEQHECTTQMIWCAWQRAGKRAAWTLCKISLFWVFGWNWLFPKVNQTEWWLLVSQFGSEVACIIHGSCTELPWFSSTHIHCQFAFHVQQLRSSITHWVIQLTVSSLPPCSLDMSQFTADGAKN